MKYTLIAFPTIDSMLCGVSCARKYSDRIELQYTDGTTETATNEQLYNVPLDFGNTFSIVSAVQHAARNN